MIAPHGQLRVYVATRPADFRKGMDGFALAVQEMMGRDPFCGAAFVFRAKRADRIKILIWDRTGMVLVQKRLESGTFVWPKERDGVMQMSPAQFSALFEGIDWRLVLPEAAGVRNSPADLRPSDVRASSGVVKRALPCGPSHHGDSTDNQQPSDVAPAHLRGAAQPVLTAVRM
jgi:transposase